MIVVGPDRMLRRGIRRGCPKRIVAIEAIDERGCEILPFPSFLREDFIELTADEQRSEENDDNDDKPVQRKAIVPPNTEIR